MEIELDCRICEGRVVFTERRRNSHGRLLGSCQTCGSVFSLFGGRVMPVDQPVRHAGAPNWRFRSLVDRERRAALNGCEVSPPAATAD